MLGFDVTDAGICYDYVMGKFGRRCLSQEGSHREIFVEKMLYYGY
jgi:hypothetical protein